MQMRIGNTSRTPLLKEYQTRGTRRFWNGGLILKPIDYWDYSLNLRGGWLADNFAFGDKDGLDQWVGKAAQARYERPD
jgi:hypothetical protein